MTFFRSMLFVCPAACLLAQTPPKPAPAGAVASPAITLSAETPKPGPSVPPDKVVLTIGDTRITAEQFDQIVQSLPQQYQASARGAARKQFADNLVRIIVLSEEAKRRKIDQTPAFKTQAQFQQANLLAGLAFEQLKDGKADEAELRKYYEAHKEEFERVRARHILIRVQGSPMPVRPGQKELSDAEALAKAQDLRKQIVGGADFANLAREQSDDQGSGANGGDLNFFGHNQMVPPFEQAAFALKPGEISEPVKSPFGYHIIKVEAHESKSFEEAKPELEKKSQQILLDALEKKANPQFDSEFFAAPPPVQGIPLPAPATAPPSAK